MKMRSNTNIGKNIIRIDILFFNFAVSLFLGMFYILKSESLARNLVKYEVISFFIISSFEKGFLVAVFIMISLEPTLLLAPITQPRCNNTNIMEVFNIIKNHIFNTYLPNRIVSIYLFRITMLSIVHCITFKQKFSNNCMKNSIKIKIRS